MRFCKNECSKKYLSIQKRSITIAISFFGREPSLRTASFDISTTHAYITHAYMIYATSSREDLPPKGSHANHRQFYLVRTARCVKSLHMYIHIRLRIYYH